MPQQTRGGRIRSETAYVLILKPGEGEDSRGKSKLVSGQRRLGQSLAVSRTTNRKRSAGCVSNSAATTSHLSSSCNNPANAFSGIMSGPFYQVPQPQETARNPQSPHSTLAKPPSGFSPAEIAIRQLLRHLPFQAEGPWRFGPPSLKQS